MSANMPKCLPALFAAIATMAFALTFTAASNATPSGWTGVVHTVSPSSSSVFNHDVASLPNGGALFAWDGYRPEPSHNYVDSSRLEGDGTVGPAVNVSVPGENGLNPDVIAADNGLASIFWSNNLSGHWMITSAGLDGTLGSNMNATGLEGRRPAPVIDADGNVSYVWVDASTSIQKIMLQRTIAGDPPGSATTVYEAPDGAYLNDLQADQDANGVMTIAWAKNENVEGGDVIQATRIETNGSTAAPTVIDTQTFGDGLSVEDVSVGPSGQAAIAYSMYDEDENEIQELAIFGTDSSVTSVALPQSGADLANPDMAFLPNGSLIYAFIRYADEEAAQARTIKVDTAGLASEPTTVSDPTRGAFGPKIVVDAAGVATIAYAQYYDRESIHAARSSNGVDWSEPVELSVGYPYSSSPRIDVDAQKNVTVSWLTNSNTVHAQQWRSAPGEPPTCENGAGESSGGSATIFSLNCSGEGAKTYEIVTPPENGTVTIDPETGAVIYTPRAGFNGTDTFTFRATNADGESEIMTFTVNVSGNDAPAGPTPDTPGALKLTDLKISQKLVPRLAVDREKLHVSFTLSRAADVRISVLRRYGRKDGGKCRSTRRIKKSGRLNRCLRDKAAFELKLGEMSAGKNNVSIPASAVRNLLNPGAYMLRVSAVASDDTKASGNRKFHVHWKSFD